ncbi:NADH-quinone oxidoreductase subunit N [Kineococcus arenarius]|uniref:NADH-quinone oxidoreductase subunit N n=1 Tax=unclassified Kineococcus TaxID=2621656 RepID=UPI003D7D2E66
MDKQPLDLVPEICLLAGALITLLSGSFLPRQRQWIARTIAVTALAGSAATSTYALIGPAHTIYAHTYAVDVTTGAVRLIVAAATLLVIGLGVDELAGSHRESETYALLLLSALGTVVMAGASDLLVLAVAFLLASVPLYALIGLARTGAAAEAVMKAYLLGALTNILLLGGVALLHALAAGTTYADLAQNLRGAPRAVLATAVVGVLAGLLFKSGAAPVHFWVPDAAQGSSVTAASFLTTVPKVGALAAAYRLLDALPGPGADAGLDRSLLVAVLAALSMTLGNLAAFRQEDPRRLLGWSTVSQVGYLLLPVAVAGRSEAALPSLLLYLAGYAVTNLGAFAVLAALPHRRTLASYRGLAREHPVLAAALTVCLLSLVGTPPTAVFIGKLTTFTAAWDGGATWLVVLAALNTVASLFYYLRWLGPVFRRDSPDPGEHDDQHQHQQGGGDRPHHSGHQPQGNGHQSQEEPVVPHPWARTTAVGAATAVLLVGLGAAPILAWQDGLLLR